MQRRPQTTNPGTRPFSAAQGRPQTHQLSKRGANARSNQALPPVRQKKPQSALPLRAPQTQVRMAFPGAQQFDVSGKYWDIVSKQTEAQIGNLVPTKTRRPMTAHVTSKGWGQVADDQALGAELPPPPGILRDFEDKLQDEARSRAAGPLQPKPFSFLSKLGGNTTRAESLMKPAELDQRLEEAKGPTELADPGTSGVVTAEVELDSDRRHLLTIFNNYDVDDFVNGQKRRGKLNRIFSAKTRQPVMTEAGSRPISSIARYEAQQNAEKKSVIKEKENEEYDELGIEEIMDDNNPESSKEYQLFQQVQEDTYGKYYRKTAEDLIKSRPTTADLQRKEKEEEVAIYPDLFDRSERTKCATFAKYGDLSYSTPVQRIGRYMDYSANLKRTHLADTISYLKTASSHMAVPTERRTPEEYLELCLFHGCMKEEPNKRAITGPAEVSGEDVEEGTYDPTLVVPEELREYLRPWASSMRREVERCQKRYIYYVEKDEIRIEELAVYNKKWMVVALEKLGDESLLRVSEDQMRQLYQDVIASYIISMKRAIMNYLLRCPLERKRLQIVSMPRTILPSSDLIIYRGGYSIEKYQEWHRRRNDSLQDVKLKLLVNNVVMSALQNWFYDFRGFHLLHFRGLRSEGGYAIGVSEFFDLERKYRRKVKGVFQHVWHRGAVMILYQFKYLKKAEQQCGKFTLKDYMTMKPGDAKAESLDYPYLDDVRTEAPLDVQAAEEYGPEALIEDKIDVVEREELLDIRESQAYINYVRFLKGTINYNDDGYKSLTKEYRTELKYSAGNLMCIQMRSVIEQTIDLIYKFFHRFDAAKVIALDTRPLGRVRKLRRDLSGVMLDIKRQRSSQYKSAEPEPEANGLEELLQQVCSGKTTTKPIWRIEMEVRGGVIDMRESKELILTGMSQLIEKIAKTFNKFVRPEFARIAFVDRRQLEYEDKEQKKKERVFMQLHKEPGVQDDIMKLKAQNMYKKYCANIRVEESEKDEKMLEQDKDIKIFMNPLVKKRANIGSFINSARERMSSRYFDCTRYVQNLISTYYDEAYQLLQIFSPFKEIASGGIMEDYKAFVQKENLVLEDYEFHVNEIDSMLAVIRGIPKVFFMTMFEVGCRDVTKCLKKVLKSCKQILKDRMESAFIAECKTITKSYKNAEGVIRRDMTSPEEVQYIEAFKSSLILDTINWREGEYKAHKILFKLMDINLIASEKVMKVTKRLHFWPERLRLTLDDVEERHKAQRAEQEQKLREKRERFEVRAGKYSLKIGVVESFREIKDYQKVMETMSKLERKIGGLEEERQTINKHEKLLFDFESPFEVFVNVKAAFTPYCELWKAIDQFNQRRQQWLQSGIAALNAPEIETQVKQNIRVLQRSLKFFDKKNHPAGHAVTEEFQREIDEIQKVVPIVEILSNPGLKQRHWVSIQNVLSAQFDWKNVTLKDIIAKGVEAHKDEITDVSDLASKEYSLEKSLSKMQEEWKKQEFVVVVKKDTDMKLLSGTRLEEMQMMLDEHIVTAQQIRANPFVKPMEEEAGNWEKKLMSLRGILDRWIKVQMDYLYLYPIFDSEDITKRLSSEASKFSRIDTLWKDLMGRVDQDKQVLNVDSIPGLVDQLDAAKKDLETIAVNLNTYLEEKRRKFPRFYFLANDDLYDILGDTRNPRKIEAYLKKIFEGVSSLTFTEDTEIVGMKSPESEEVSFLRKVVPLEYHGNVESMLLDIETEMKDTVGKSIEKAIDSYNSTPERIDWVLKQWPGQVVLCVSQLFWCKKITEAIGNRSIKELQQYLQVCEKQLKDIVTLVRGKLTKLQRITLSALTVLDVHANDVLESLVHNNVSSETDFEWLSQLRYYYDFIAKGVEIRMITTSIGYGNEYIGNTSRLVITPLTDRCYRTMMSAMKVNLGGAPEGPAGTGKTETVKDLSKAVAVKILVFNCSEGIDYRSMAKLFKGLASAGAWSCFDEFNRIEPEVLSVIAQQILAIQTAKTQEATTFEFDGGTIPLRSTCNVFITMNPGYVGRAELPDNLKALFRPVAMMVPDYAMIAEIRLYSTGFLEARAMAKKIVATYRLCSEQLSSQSHYDYGMRAVIAVLTAAGQLKRKYPGEEEALLTLRAIHDVNLPKFVAGDIQLFKWIISDLFPGVYIASEQELYGELMVCINQALEKLKLQPVERFIEKVIQLYETINCRHGLMLVGDAVTGKSAAYKVLSEALNIMAAKSASAEQKKETEGEGKEVPVEYFVINPKAVPLDQLYGSLDRISQEWTEGVLAKTFRDCAVMKGAGLVRRWLILDGPVDTLWIESMNTVLDDNKMLCLMNGDIISMPEKMSMLFEVSDLAKASLATVSRCGMIYMQNETIHWSSLLQSWLKGLSDTFAPDLLKRLDLLFDAFVAQCYSFMQKRCVQYIKLSEMHLAMNLMRMLEGLLRGGDMVEKCKDPRMKQEDLICRLDVYFLYALIWSVGCNTNEQGNKKFSEFLRNLSSGTVPLERLKEKPIRIDKSAQLPESSLSLHSYFIDNCRWRLWREQMEKWDKEDHPWEEGLKFHEVVIPTTDTFKFNYMIEFMVNNKTPLLVLGPTGTGKTLYVNSFMKSLSVEKFVTSFVGFSAQTTASQTQDILEAKLEPRKRGVFAPRYPKRLVVFVDDLNMPAVESCGAQPPIELLRQFLDTGAWYSKDKEKKLKHIEDTLLIAAMGPPGGGRNEVTNRMLRHFHVLTFNSFDETVLQRIFTNMMAWHVKTAKLPTDLVKLLSGVVGSTIDVYNFVCEKLLHTPEKFHYLFNMRDIARVVQGVQMANLKAINSKKLIRLFVHEISRVFLDRLITEHDKQLVYQYMFKTVRDKLRDDLKQSLAEVVPVDVKIDINTNHETLKYVIFADVMSEGISTYERTYDQTLLGKPLYEKVNYYLEEYNSASRKPMTLVLFDFAIEHLLRICRVLRMSKGNALLVGLGGSGRQSLTKLATFMCEFQLFDVEMSKNYNRDQWHDDMKNMLRASGAEDKRQVFVLSDSQMKFDFILEDVNNLLNTGEIPNLWAHDEKLDIAEKARLIAKKDGRLNLFNHGNTERLYDFFVEKVNFNLHIVMAMSPIGGSLRTKMRMFPSIVNCCTIDWFGRWPETGLRAVADKFLKETDVVEPELSQLVQICTEMHTHVQNISDQYLRQDKRYNYVTPTTYIELIQSYKELLKRQRENIMKMKLGYMKGIEKMDFATKEVEIKQKELQEKEPFLVEMNKNTAELITKVNKQMTEVVEPKKKIVMEEEMLATQQAQEAEQLLADCTQELAKFTPKLKEAQNKMDALGPSEINELKSYKDPPKLVKVVLEAVVVLREFPIIYTPNPNNPKEQEPNMWATAKKLLSQQNFLNGFKTFDYNNIPLEVAERIRRKYISELNPTRLKDVSVAAHALCLWIRAVEEYDKAYRIIKPKEQRAKEAKAAYKLKRENLKRIQEELQSVMQTLEEMQRDLDDKQKKKAELEAQITDCKVKITRARTLLEGLGGEKTRWAESIVDLQAAYENTIGDMLVSAGVIAYLGVFPAKYRNPTVKKWVERCAEAGIKANANFSLEKCLGEPVFIREWVLNGLPTDSFSKENALIATLSRRWPLMVDPEGQANRWIKNQYQDKNLNVVKLADDYMRAFKKAVPFGEPLLLENVGTEIDPALNSLLLKQTFKHAGVMSIKLGDGIIDYSKDFLFFITTKLRSPHFLPELSTKVTVIDFALTYDGLKDQMLDLVVQKEKQELDEKRSRLIKQNYEYKKELKRREDNILEVLRNTQGNILDNEAAVNALKESQEAAVLVKEKQQIAQETEASIEVVRSEYVPIAQHVAALYFIVSNLGSVNEMYQYSLSWYVMLFGQSIDNSEKSEYIEQRLDALKENFTYLLYENVIRSLFEKDKLLFSFMLACCIQESQGLINLGDYRFLISHVAVQTNPLELENPAKAWLPETVWNGLCALAEASPATFAALPDSLRTSAKDWKNLYEGLQSQKGGSPRKSQLTNSLPAPFKTITEFERLCLLKVLTPDKLVAGVKDFVTNTMGTKFLYYPPFDLERAFKDSITSTPLIFVLPGTDPMAILRTFAQARGKFDTLKSVSLGQDQGPLAVSYIEEAKRTGSWVLLQNCHLAPSFMSTLEKICDGLQGKVSKDQMHPSFRLWLTSYASEHFPVLVLQNGIKLTNEPPKGTKANMLGSFMMHPISSPDFFEGCNGIFKRLLLGLCFFHSMIQERRSFGPLGWNIPYDYNQSDLFISVKQLHTLLQGATKDTVERTFKSLRYLIGECNYGGRVTDDKDRRLLKSLLDDVFSLETLKPGYCPSGLAEFAFPDLDLKYEDYCTYISKQLPDEQPAELFGFHENAFMSRNIKESNDMVSSMQRLGDGQFQSKRSAEEGHEFAQNTAGEREEEDPFTAILNKLPDKCFDMEAVEKKYPPLYENSMNTVLTQELVRFNMLLRTIRTSLSKILGALKGEQLMSSELEEVFNSVQIGRIPDLWRARSYPSQKPLAAYIEDLKVRLMFFKNWVDTTPPIVYWMSGFFFTQGFLTGTLQNYARKQKIEIDALSFEFEFFDEDPTDYSVEIMPAEKCKLTPPVDGVYITGLHLEGCRWDFEAKVLAESRPKVLFTKAPIIWLKPQRTAVASASAAKEYSCPVYKTAERRGTLESTGHSTNYIMDIKMPIDCEAGHWIKRGVAMVCQLSA